MNHIATIRMYCVAILVVGWAILLTWLIVIEEARAQPGVQASSGPMIVGAVYRDYSIQTTSTPAHTGYLPSVMKDWSPPTPTATPTPPPTSDIPCLYALNWWRNPDPPYNIIRSSYSPPCLMATQISVTHIIDGIGRQTAYLASVTRQGQPNFDMDATYLFNTGGGVIGANVTKTYGGGYVYQMEITQFCPSVGPLVGYKVLYEGQVLTFGTCP